MTQSKANQHKRQISRGIKHGYRSGLEDRCAKKIEQFGHEVVYEKTKIHYIKPSTAHTYTPDFKISTPNGYFYIESKGRWTTEDRKKHLLIKEQWPDLDLRLVFQNCNTKLYKGSPTTYGSFAEKHGFMYACKEIPDEWLCK